MTRRPPRSKRTDALLPYTTLCQSPMVDVNGNVIGINTRLISPTGGNVGIGFAIPAEQARPVIEALRRGERPVRGYIGVSLQPPDEVIADSLGIPRHRGELIRGVPQIGRA